MRVSLLAVAALAACTTGLFAQEPRLANPKRVFATSQPEYRRANQYHCFTMRISPGGKHVLYTRPAPGSEQSDERSARYQPVLRELDGQKETVLPVEPFDRGFQTFLTRFNMFDPAGKRLLLPRVERQQLDANRSGQTKWSIYDVAQGRLGAAIEGGSAGPAKFTADGQALLLTGATGPGVSATSIVSLKEAKAQGRPLSAPGWVQSVSPAGDVAAFFVTGRPATRPQPGERVQRPPVRLVLWDLKADKELTQIMTHPRNGELDDWETQWTTDGRYLYYVDVDEVAAKDQASKPTYRSVTRIWDRQAGKHLAMIPDVVPVGPGPGSCLMVLARGVRENTGGFILHDAAGGKEYAIGDASKKLIHAFGTKVLYAEKPADSKTEGVFSADIVAPESAPQRGEPQPVSRPSKKN